jgi:hypothetical protein
VSGDLDGDHYVSAVTVTATSADSGSGIATTEYNLNQTYWVHYDMPIVIDADGSHSLAVRAYDNAGNERSQTADFVIATPAPTPEPTPDNTPVPTQIPGTLLGDVNLSGTVDIVDALLVSQFYVGQNPPNFYPDNADVNLDGFIDAVDSLLIAQYYTGLIPTLPPPGITPYPTEDPTPEPTAGPTP